MHFYVIINFIILLITKYIIAFFKYINNTLLIIFNFVFLYLVLKFLFLFSFTKITKKNFFFFNI